MNYNDTALQMAWTRTHFLHHKSDGTVLDPHWSTCCSSDWSSLCPCMFSSPHPLVCPSVSVLTFITCLLSNHQQLLWLSLFQLLTSLKTLICFSHFFSFTVAKKAAMSPPHFMITTGSRNTTWRHTSHFTSNHPSRYNTGRYCWLLYSINVLFVEMQQPRLG